MAASETVASDSHRPLRGDAVLVIWGGVDPDQTDEEELNAWWTNEHLPERLGIPGFERTRRFYSQGPASEEEAAATSRYLVSYEVASLDTLTSPAYMTALNSPTAGTKKFMPLLTSMNRSACRVLYSTGRPEFGPSGGALGATIAHIVFEVSSDNSDDVRKWIVEVGWPSLAEFPSSLALHLLEHDRDASSAGSSTKSYEDVAFKAAEGNADTSGSKWMLLVEFSESPLAPFGKAAGLAQTVVDKLEELQAADIECQLYGLICTASA